MICPNCKTEELEEQIFYKVGADYCYKCLGVFFDQDELRQAKDEKDQNLNWLDIDLWDNPARFRVFKAEKLCPKCEMPMYLIQYGDSDIEVDLCNVCQGIWLDRAEFKKIIEYLKAKEPTEVLQHYFKALANEALEVFVGPENFKEELADFISLLKLLNYKFVVQHPKISQMIANLPK